MTAPASFQLNPVKDGDHLPPEPTRRLKNQIYQDLSFFHDVDEHAISVWTTLLSSFFFVCSVC